ncbi:MAG: hypothetical protein HYS13_06020 [Planctomycetia bacterium]|nr:hypothetical protein [Planctomycetia bacterium]
MSARPSQTIALCLHLARACEARRQPGDRDKMLVLAGAAAAALGLHTVAGRCRRKILAQNPGHLIGHHESFAQAAADDEFAHYLKQLERAFPPEKLEHMLASLEIDMASERATYASDYEYAAALLGTTIDELERASREVPKPKGEPLPARRIRWWLVVVLSAVLLAMVIAGVWLLLESRL